MTCTTKLDGVDGLKVGRIENRLLFLILDSHAHFRNVLRTRAVAGFTGNPGDQVTGIKLIAGRRCCRMAAKAKARFPDLEESAESAPQAARNGVLVAWAEVQTLNVGVVAQAALVPLAILLVNVGLPHLTQAKCPSQRDGNRFYRALTE